MKLAGTLLSASIALVVGGVFCSCSVFSKKDAADANDLSSAKSQGSYPVGLILLTNPEDGYVVFRKIANLPATAAQLTVAREKGEAPRLRLSAQTNPPFYAAEILSGDPQRGEYIRALAADAPTAQPKPKPNSEQFADASELFAPVAREQQAPTHEIPNLPAEILAETARPAAAQPQPQPKTKPKATGKKPRKTLLKDRKSVV